MDFLADFGMLLLGVTFDIAPMVIVLFAFQLFVVGRPIPNPRAVVVGLVYVTLGLGLFLIGLEKALFPLGQSMARQLADPAFLGAPGGASGGSDTRGSISSPPRSGSPPPSRSPR